MLKVKDVAKLLDVSPLTVYRLVYAGKLKSVKVGGAVRIKESWLDNFIESNKTVKERK